MKTIGRILLVMGILAMTALTGQAVAQTKAIKVGAAINLTGPASSWGQFHEKGQRDYFRYVNEEKGGVGGRKIEMITMDTAYKVPEAQAAVQKFILQDKVDMIATWGAGEGLAAKPIVQKHKVPTINYSTSWEILEKPVGYMYLPFGSYKMDCRAVLEYIKTIHTGNGAPKVGLLTYNNAYGRSIHAPSREYAAKLGVQLVAIEEFPPRTVDLNTELLRLQKKGAQYIFIQMLPSTIITAFKSADRIKYNPLFLGTWTSTDPDFFRMGRGLIRDRLVMQFPGGLPSDKAKGMEVMKELWKRYKTVKSFDASYWEGVVVGMIMERAFLRAWEKSKVINPETVNAAMESMKNEDFGGLVPAVSYSKTNHEGSFTARMVKVMENGTYIPLTNFYIPGKDKIKVLKR
ncbi:MAG: ABC transporter substrate-binding protein [Smithellaceae bacterium]|jgi:branched-chain amino acid transport system substrate-binding protein|nr:ABC transporter substrate-binding protein [Smithellaceae bacterium]MDD3258073.1 ABC transporter substrate-binding protein [Smithellaceae bacterium]MDD3848068.1 ABC transporter substrate-binding protein [Smithellaceae bacterium]HOG11387.1 ABC transporter substrate-binding protein [Smithellaceae bacterium]HOQ71181.1 ABC transporter substrate-binding protein [Smithellaceae bacterium]